jgi:hypothetical protein
MVRKQNRIIHWVGFLLLLEHIMGSNTHCYPHFLLCAWTWLVTTRSLEPFMDFNNFGKGNSKSFKIVEIRVICKVKFGHTQGEIQKKNLQKGTLAYNGG